MRCYNWRGECFALWHGQKSYPTLLNLVYPYHMNLRDLKYLVTLAETCHFSRAAQRCCISQPTLSGQIKKLEDELGVMIFERNNRSVHLTAIGEHLLVHAQKALEQADAIEQVARAYQDVLAGPLRLGVIPTLSPYLLPLILSPLRTQYPQLRLVLFEELTDTLLQRLRHHQLDALLLATPISDPELQALTLFDEPFWLAHPRGHALDQRTVIRTADLEMADLLLLAEGHCLTDQVMEVCHLAERPRDGELADLRAAGLETLLHLVASGFGCTLVPALALDSGWATDPRIRIRALPKIKAERRITLVFRTSFPRIVALHALAQVIGRQLPASVNWVGAEDELTPE